MALGDDFGDLAEFLDPLNDQSTSVRQYQTFNNGNTPKKIDLDGGRQFTGPLLNSHAPRTTSDNFIEKVTSNATSQGDGHHFDFNGGKDIDSGESDGEGFDFEKYNPDKEKKAAKFSDLRGNIRGGGATGDHTIALKLDNFEQLIGERELQQMENKSLYTASRQLRKRNIHSNNARERMNPMMASDPTELSVSFRDQTRHQLLSTVSNTNKKNIIKRIWHKAPALNINTYKIQFQMQGEKVRFDHHDSFPVCLLGVKFQPEQKPAGGQNYSNDISNRYKTMIKTKYFESLIWCSYRNKMENDILSDASSQRYLEQVLPKELGNLVSYNTDMNWGCTVRVGQMLVCNALMRHLLIDAEFRYTKAEAFDKFGMYN